MIAKSNYILFGFTEWVNAPQGYFLRGALQHVYAYMDVGGRATQEQLPSSPVYPPGYVKSSLLRVLRSRYLCIHARQLTKGAAISSIFASFSLSTVHPCTTPHYTSQANTTAWTQEVERIRRQSRELLYTLSNCGF